MFKREQFRRTRVMQGCKPKVGGLLLKSLKECEDVDTANEYLAVANMLELPNISELQDLFDEKFPSNLKTKV